MTTAYSAKLVTHRMGTPDLCSNLWTNNMMWNVMFNIKVLLKATGLASLFFLPCMVHSSLPWWSRTHTHSPTPTHTQRVVSGFHHSLTILLPVNSSTEVREAKVRAVIFTVGILIFNGHDKGLWYIKITFHFWRRTAVTGLPLVTQQFYGCWLFVCSINQIKWLC